VAFPSAQINSVTSPEMFTLCCVPFSTSSFALYVYQFSLYKDWRETYHGPSTK